MAAVVLHRLGSDFGGVSCLSRAVEIRLSGELAVFACLPPQVHLL
jgi:hypothetical protein